MFVSQIRSIVRLVIIGLRAIGDMLWPPDDGSGHKVETSAWGREVEPRTIAKGSKVQSPNAPLIYHTLRRPKLSSRRMQASGRSVARGRRF